MAADVEAVAQKARELEAEAVLVGMPFTLKGKKGFQARQVEDFCKRLEEDGGVSVSTWDERFSTFEAESRLRAAGRKPSREKGRSDAAAAAVILQSYLDSRRDQ
jgi:putative Holliday junction resolvase